jgi:hypothetical protein
MVKRLRTTSFAGFGAILLALIVSGMVAAASLLTAIAAPSRTRSGRPGRHDADVRGRQRQRDRRRLRDGRVADEAARRPPTRPRDLNGDGTVSVSEAAQSDRVGGTNCNHGGYVSQVAHERATDATTGTTTPRDVDRGATNPIGESEDAERRSRCPRRDADTRTRGRADQDAPTCDTGAHWRRHRPRPTPRLPTRRRTTARSFSAVAGSDAVGGKNCNHGGAVSEASHKDNEARKAARDAAKAARDAARAAKHAAKGHGH